MSELHVSVKSSNAAQEATAGDGMAGEKVMLEKPKKVMWEKPEMQDVSEEVMAQPYIRFT